jgi:TM2 domain-containing membrane protein YozV
MYYLAINGQRTGPYTAQDIQQMLRQGAIGYETLCWREGMQNWEAVSTQRHLFESAYRQPSPAFQPPVYHQQPVQIYQPLVVQPVLINPPKSRVAYILLGLFLGGLGVHNFYAGYSSKGVTQLLLTLLLFWTIVVPIAVSIWIIVEICTVDRDAYGNPMT